MMGPGNSKLLVLGNVFLAVRAAGADVHGCVPCDFMLKLSTLSRPAWCGSQLLVGDDSLTSNSGVGLRITQRTA